MASYAKQAGDDSLHKMAVKIQARAIQKCGLLLKAMVPHAHPGNQKNTIEKIGESNHMTPHVIETLTLARAAKLAGLSTYKKNKILAVASIPQAKFEAMVEHPQGVSIKQLVAPIRPQGQPDFLGHPEGVRPNGHPHA